MNDEKASQTVEQLLEGVDLFDDTLYAIVRKRKTGLKPVVSFVYGQDELRRELAVELLFALAEERYLVMPVSRTVLAELQPGKEVKS